MDLPGTDFPQRDPHRAQYLPEACEIRRRRGAGAHHRLANSVAAPALEFHAEGEVFGVGCKIFTIAGPVILYGVLTSWVLGLGYWMLTSLGIL